MAEIEPSAAGFDATRLKRLDRYLDGCVERDLNKGSIVMVARHGKLVHVSRRGLRDAEARLPVEMDTIWRLYSMTKPVTSVALLTLWEEGLLSLSDPVEEYIPSFANMTILGADSPPDSRVPATEPIRISHLLTHTAGLTVTGMADNAVDAAYRRAGIAALAQPEDYTLAELCERLAALPLLFEPGSAYNYSHATDVLGRVIEVVSGTSLDQFMQQRIFDPLRMPDTGFRIPERDRLSALYLRKATTGDTLRLPDFEEPAGELPTLVAGGHGLMSTAPDYYRFAQMLAHGGELDGQRVLSPRTVASIAANHLPGGALLSEFTHPPTRTGAHLQGRGFGFGVTPLLDPVGINSLSSLGEYGWGGAAGTNFWIDPQADLVVLFMMHVIPPPEALWVALRNLVYQALVE
ncbi:serine hydrolase domain-containing protein [Amycolatopsis ultiminotia]|uniref:Serine hydrolase domain-containing protein n=1 Tax=Amycolatopsis ultiminotia TaxID=543629 RepID=A0ABP6WGW3_9PSEU